MFETLALPPDDPILSLGGLAQADPRPEKLDLGIGVYIDETGRSPVMAAVARAEQQVLDRQVSKAYLSPRGNAAFLSRLGNRLFSPELWSSRLGTIEAMQTVGCVAALRLGAELLARLGARRIRISGPTWPIHAPIFTAAGLEPVEYRYYKAGSAGLDWPAMLASLEAVEPGDAVLLHGCCHNPTGADPSLEQWKALAKLLAQRRAIAFFDIAYAGLGRGWNEDLEGFRVVIEALDEAIVAVSGSKSFGLYRERVGALFFAGRNPEQVAAVLAQGLAVARTSYSMPPDHGAATVAEILGDPQLTAEWLSELESMRARIAGLRATLADEAQDAGLDWDYLRHQRGMFSLLPLQPADVVQLRLERAVYMPTNGRICIPGLTAEGARHLARSCADLRKTAAPTP